MFELMLTLCTGWTAGVIHGPPGRCMNTSREPAGVYRTLEQCDAAYRRQVYLNEVSYTYVGLFFDRRVRVNRVRSGECLKQ